MTNYEREALSMIMEVLAVSHRPAVQGAEFWQRWTHLSEALKGPAPVRRRLRRHHRRSGLSFGTERDLHRVIKALDAVLQAVEESQKGERPS